MIADNVQTAIDPMCFRLDIIETVLREDGDDESDTGAEARGLRRILSRTF